MSEYHLFFYSTGEDLVCLAEKDGEYYIPDDDGAYLGPYETMNAAMRDMGNIDWLRQRIKETALYD